jgi:hypothetical protein
MKQVLATVALGMIWGQAAYALDGVVLIPSSTTFPYKITQPGSYRLSANLVVTGLNTDGIDIDSDNVTLDLNGFTISGPGTLSTAKGIVSANQNITIKNGFVTGFKEGIFLTGSGSLSDLIVSSNGDVGVTAVSCGFLDTCTGVFSFEASQNGFVIVRCIAQNNVDSGFNVTNAIVSESVADGNSAGIIASASTLIHNVISNNSFGLGWFGLGGYDLFGRNRFFGNGRNVYSTSTSQGNNLCTSGTGDC